MEIYYKADIFISHETYENNDKTQGVDFDSWSEVGHETVRHASLIGLIQKLESFTGSLIERDDGDVPNRYFSYGEDEFFESYNTTGERNNKEIKVLITYDIRIFKVSETPIDVKGK